MGRFDDVFEEAERRASVCLCFREKLFEESVSSALHALENSWAGLIGFWVMERKRDTLEKALKLGELAERVFPESPRVLNAVEEAREKAARAGLLPTDER